MTKYFAFKFTLVNRFTLERLENVFAFGHNLPSAIRNLRKLFPCQLYDVETSICSGRFNNLIIVGYSTLEDLL